MKESYISIHNSLSFVNNKAKGWMEGVKWGKRNPSLLCRNVGQGTNLSLSCYIHSLEASCGNSASVGALTSYANDPMRG